MDEITSFSENNTKKFPATRYQGAKRRVILALRSLFETLSFNTVLDAFGGSGVVSYLLKEMGKGVTYNDILTWNYDIARALIENNEQTLPPDKAIRLLKTLPGRPYQNTVSKFFHGIYFTDKENKEIDCVIQNIDDLSGFSKQIAKFALYQTCLIKRPYNLFHRANLSLRLAKVSRSFGNKTSWDRPIQTYLSRFTQEANRAIFRGKHPCVARCQDATTLPGNFDLVYADPPYISQKGVGVDYLSFYHFLEGLARYREWPPLIETQLRHRPIKAKRSPWSDPKKIGACLDTFFDRWKHSILVLSYRSDGIPSPEEILKKLRQWKKHVRVFPIGKFSYALSKVRSSQELVFVAE